MTKPPLTATVSAICLIAIVSGCSASRPTAGSVSCGALALVGRNDPKLADLRRDTQDAIIGNDVAIARNCPDRPRPGPDVNAIWGRR